MAPGIDEGVPLALAVPFYRGIPFCQAGASGSLNPEKPIVQKKDRLIRNCSSWLA